MNGIEDWMPRLVRLVEATLKKKDISEYRQFVKLNPAEKREYVLMNWRDFLVEADPECVERMNSILHPLLKNTVKKDAVEVIKTYFAPMLASATKSTIDLHLDMFRASSDASDRTDSEVVQSLLASYLNLFAGVFGAQVDMLVWVRILSGKEYYRLEKGRRIPRKLGEFVEVQKESDYYKLAYLGNEGFQSVTEACDKDLRNAIAHNDYLISGENVISYNISSSKTRVAVDRLGLKEKHLRLVMMVDCINKSMEAFYVDWARETMRSMPDGVREALSKQLPPNFGDEESSDSDDG